MRVMKKTKKLFALLLTVVMMLAMSVTSFAAQEGTLENGSITIDNAVSGETYTIYQLMYLESYNPASGAYAYKANSAWVDWLETQTEYLAVDSQDYVTWVEGASAADFAKAALAHAQEEGMANDGQATATSASVTFNNLKLGYYLVDTSVGALCSLNTTNPNTTIKEKNSVPSITKMVKEDSTGAWQESATVDVTDTVFYQLTVNTGTNAAGSGTGVDSNYVIKDTLPAGFTYNNESVEIADWTLDTDYTVAYNNQTRVLTITLLSDGKLAALGQNADIVITYDAAVDATQAVIGGNGNTNTVTLEYKSQTSTDSAKVYTFEIGDNFKKVDGKTKEALAGVKFILSKVDRGTTKYATFDENGNLTGWVESEDAATKLETDRNGNITAKGLDADTYILTETDALPGYNVLNDTITVNIAENGTVTFKLTNGEGAADIEITVENNSGSILPSTGGMGTTLIYIMGAVLVIGAGIVLVVRRRMNAE